MGGQTRAGQPPQVETLDEEEEDDQDLTDWDEPLSEEGGKEGSSYEGIQVWTPYQLT
jgi:hypothetical protein